MGKIDKYNFVCPGEDIRKDDSVWAVAANLDRSALKARWQTQRGRALLDKLKAAHLDRAVLKREVGASTGISTCAASTVAVKWEKYRRWNLLPEDAI